MDEQAVDEFAQKFEHEIVQNGGTVESTERIRQQMVRTKTNKGSRNVYTLTTKFTISSEKITDINKYMKLTEGNVINYMFLLNEALAQPTEAA